MREGERCSLYPILDHDREQRMRNRGRLARLKVERLRALSIAPMSKIRAGLH
jgi:hypothetical protein